MQRPLAIVGFVFVVGFGLGYGTTWLLAGSPGALEAAPPASPVAEAPASPAPAPAAPPVVTAAPPVVAVAPAPAETPAADVIEAPSDVVEPAEVLAEADAAAPDAGPTPSAPAAAPASHPCVGRVCRLDFMGVAGGLPVRNAELVDGKSIEWQREFGMAPKLGFIPSGPAVNVEVRAVGFKEGVPIAASVVYRSRGKVLSGVISLAIGTKQLSLIPE